jgi:molybdopterin-guanine dinucleotide biosynthesis protein A
MTSSFNSTIKSNECLGVVLAGGLSSRMGSDKAHLLRNSKTKMSMLEFSKKILMDSGIANIIVSGDKYDIPDTVKKNGPVGGILSVLSAHPQAKSLLILPIDLPFMTAKALADLRLKGELSQKATYFEGHNIPLYLPNSAYVQSFLAQAFQLKNNVINSTLGKKARSASSMNKKGPSIKALLNHVPNQAIQSNDKNVLFNTNTPEQWQKAKQHFNFQTL